MPKEFWRYQRGNKKIEEGHAIQWPKEKGQKDKQRSTKHTHKTKDRVTRTPLTIGGEIRRTIVYSSLKLTVISTALAGSDPG